MKNRSIRFKITLGFSAVLVTIVVLAFVVFVTVTNSVMQKGIKDNLVETIENNVDEIEYFKTLADLEKDNDRDQYIQYDGGYLEIDDDFLDKVNGISTSLYHQNNTMLYGENPLVKQTSNEEFVDGEIHNIKIDGTVYYIFDRNLNQNGLGELWLRGIVSEKQGTSQLQTVVRSSLIFLPAFIVICVLIGYYIAGRVLRPIKYISVTAAQIGSGDDLKKRINLGQGNDELHQLSNTFDEMFQRLETSFESEKQFTSDASHELRTPVSVIMAQCEYILEQSRTAEEYKDAIKVIKRQNIKTSRLIEDMLDFTRMEQNSQRLKKERFNLSEQVESICKDMKLIQTKGITLDYNVEKEIFFTGNIQLISRAITNYINNAYNYGKENGNINVTLKKENENILILVADDGIGISAKEQDKIFNRFYMGDCARNSNGTGLGLAMVKEIANFHGGKVEVESKPHEGAVFKIILPL